MFKAALVFDGNALVTDRTAFLSSMASSNLPGTAFYIIKIQGT